MIHDTEDNTFKKITTSFLVAVILMICLCITSYALGRITVSKKENHFKTGSIGVNLNDGKPVIEEHEFLFEPGMTVTKPFFIENTGTWDVYYKMYFEDVKGGLAKVLEITIRDGDTVLYQGTAAELSKEAVETAKDPLPVGEKRDMTITFHYPENAGNAGQTRTLSFTLCAQAVQTKNNPDRLFE